MNEEIFIKIDHMYSGAVYDALRILGLRDYEFMLANDIRPLREHYRVFGPAFTMRGEVVGPSNYKSHDMKRLSAYPYIVEDSVVVLSTNDKNVAHAGDITLRFISRQNAMGFVTDGFVRDSRIITSSLDIQCFCAGSCPIDAIDYWAVTKFQTEIHMRAFNGGTIRVRPGDYIFADCDGAMVIPKEMLTPFQTTLVEKMADEDEIRRMVTRGVSAQDIYDNMGRW